MQGDGNMQVNISTAELAGWFSALDHVLPHARIALSDLNCAEDGERSCSWGVLEHAAAWPCGGGKGVGGAWVSCVRSEVAVELRGDSSRQRAATAATQVTAWGRWRDLSRPTR